MSCRNRLANVPIIQMMTAAVLGFVVTGCLTALAAQEIQVSQKGRTFHPGEVQIRRGEIVVILNDDADLLHHAYINDPNFSYDSGDQGPGSKTSITFPVAGTFNVLCAIHPKMKLVVQVK